MLELTKKVFRPQLFLYLYIFEILLLDYTLINKYFETSFILVGFWIWMLRLKPDPDPTCPLYLNPILRGVVDNDFCGHGLQSSYVYHSNTNVFGDDDIDYIRNATLAVVEGTLYPYCWSDSHWSFYVGCYDYCWNVYDCFDGPGTIEKAYLLHGLMVRLKNCSFPASLFSSSNL